MIQLARDLARLKRPRDAREVRFVLFDGEEPAAGLPEEQTDFYATGLRGSRADARRNARATKRDDPARLRRQQGPAAAARGHLDDRAVGQLRRAARHGGVASGRSPTRSAPRSPTTTRPSCSAGVPAVDLIDWSYPGHRITDTLDKLSVRSMDAVGESVLGLVQNLRTR